MKVKAMNGVARILKAEGVEWISCYPHPIHDARTRGVPIYMMVRGVRIAVADAFSRLSCASDRGVHARGSPAAGIKMRTRDRAGREDSSRYLSCVRAARARPPHALDIARAEAGHQMGRRIDARLVPDYISGLQQMRSGRRPVRLIPAMRPVRRRPFSSRPEAGPVPIRTTQAAIKALRAAKIRYLSW